MGRLSASILAVALGALAVLGLAACGSDSPELLPGGTASEITSNLDQVKELATEGDCVGAEDAAQAVSTQIEDLDGVDPKLKQGLREGATRLNEVVAGCEEAPEEPKKPSPAVEPAEELEEPEKPEKPVKPAKQEKPEKEAVEPTEETSPTLPPQAEGKAKGHENPPKKKRPRSKAAAAPRRAGSGRARRRGANSGGGNPLRALRNGGAARLRRDVERLQGDRPDPRAHGRGEDPRRAPLRRRALRRPLPPRGAGGGEADPSQHRPGLRHRHRRRPPLHRHGVRLRPLRGADPAAARPGRAGDRGRDRDPGLRRARLRAPARDHPPRRQARQPDGHRRPGRRRRR